MNTRAIVMSSLVLLGSAAHAEGFYVLGSFGQSRFSDDYSKSDKNAFAEHYFLDDVASSSEDDKDSAYKLMVGYQFNEDFAVEGGYIDLGQSDYKVTTDLDLEGKLETSAKGWNVNALLTLPINAGFSVFFKAGAVGAELERKLTSDDGDWSESERKIKPNAGVGVNYDFAQGFMVRAEYERFFALGDGDIEVGLDGVEGGTGEVDIDLFTLGLGYRF